MKKNSFIKLFPLIAILFSVSVNAQDTIHVMTQNMVHMTSPPMSYNGWGVFPADTTSYRKIYLNFTLGCPSPKCSSWDYTVDIYLNQNTHHKDSTLLHGPTFTVNGNIWDSVKTKKDTTYTTFYDTTNHVTDSTKNAFYTIVQYKDCAHPTVPTDTVHWWVAAYYNYYYNNLGQKIDSIWITPDTSMYVAFCSYYSAPFDSIAQYEIARMITPYGSTYSSTWTNPYKFDVTDFASLLHDSAQISVFYSGWSDGFLATCDFEMITGYPDHKAYKATKLWTGTFPYGSTGDPISNYLTPYYTNGDTAAHATRLRIIQTGHGEDGNNCTEFCANFQHVFVDGKQHYTPLVWRDDCGKNSLWAQNGTWLYDRANWCPGSLVNPYLDDLTPYLHKGRKDTVLVTMDPYTTPNGGSVYIFGSSLINYGPIKFKLDAAVEDIISPNMYAPYSRMNPICGSPQVVIRNTGADTLKSLVFNYGQVTGGHFTYTWTGKLPFDDTTLVYLPPVDLKSGTVNKFEVTISNPNGGTDMYADNNYYQVPYDTVPTYPADFIIRFSTNTKGFEDSYFLVDGNGNKFHVRSGFGSSKTYRDTIHLAPGCYHFEMDDNGGKDGINFPYNSDGAGSLVFAKITTGLSFNTLQANFGTMVCQNFDVGRVTSDGEMKYAIDYAVYPNPAKNQLTLAGLTTSQLNKTVRIYSTMGTLVYETTVKAGMEQYNINLEGFASGIYCVIISNTDGQVVKKVMVTR